MSSVTLAVLIAVGGVACASDPSRRAVTSSTTRAPARPTVTTVPAPPVALVATAIPRHVSVREQPEGPSVHTLANPSESGAPLTFLVTQQQGANLEVLLPTRPNGSTGWISAKDVTVVADPYRIVVQLGAHRLVAYNRSAVVLDAAIGVGTRTTPTPGGRYYIKELLKPSNPNGPYGPHAYGLSGFSNVITKFAGGDGVIGIHGTNEPQLVGTDVSHGCIRLKNDDIEKLVPLLPLGTPVEIQA
jgi:lipoprotein-anchoring transpeptidase ErfK/SrfK